MNRSRTPSHAIDISEEDGVRYLHFGSDWVQGAMRIARPWALELPYTREMLFALLLRPPRQWPRRVLLIGLGAGSLAKFIYRYLPDSRITVVEINPQVEFVARQYFKLPDDPQRLEVIIDCGADYLLGGNHHFDAIFLDGFDPAGRRGPLDTQPVLAACRARLSEHGLFCVNLLGNDRNFKAAMARVDQAFDGRTLALPACESGNVIQFAHTGERQAHSIAEMHQVATEIRKTFRLNLLPTLQRLEQQASPEHRGTVFL